MKLIHKSLISFTPSTKYRSSNKIIDMQHPRHIGRSLELVRPSFSAFFRSEPAAFVFPCTPRGGGGSPWPPTQYRRARNLINAMFAIIIPVTIFWQDKVFRSTCIVLFLTLFLNFFNVVRCCERDMKLHWTWKPVLYTNYWVFIPNVFCILNAWFFMDFCFSGGG